MKKLIMSLFIVLLISSRVPAFAQEIYDPWEPFNRKIFWFNDKFDVYLLEPVARGYYDYTPRPIRKGIGNFFENLKYPRYLVSDIVQLKFGQVLHHTGRFLLNTTVGLLGFIDVAKDVGLEEHSEDFGVALAYHGVPEGPYMVLPILGPSNLRDAFGRLVDVFTDPFFYVRYSTLNSDQENGIIFGAKTIEAIDTRADLLEAVETSKESSLDYYLFLQSTYHQYREGVIYDGNPPSWDDKDVLQDDVTP